MKVYIIILRCQKFLIIDVDVTVSESPELLVVTLVTVLEIRLVIMINNDV